MLDCFRFLVSWLSNGVIVRVYMRLSGEFVRVSHEFQDSCLPII